LRQAQYSVERSADLVAHVCHELAAQLGQLLCGVQRLLARTLFGAPRPDATVLVNLAKALATYQATLVSPRTRFDDFRDALARGDKAAAARYPAPARRGLKLFVGVGQCFVCHAGPMFTNGEFGDVGRPFFTADGIDPGRWGGLQLLLASPYNRACFPMPGLRIRARSAPGM
jgi:cytochrome c peroxidase